MQRIQTTTTSSQIMVSDLVSLLANDNAEIRKLGQTYPETFAKIKELTVAEAYRDKTLREAFDSTEFLDAFLTRAGMGVMDLNPDYLSELNTTATYITLTKLMNSPNGEGLIFIKKHMMEIIGLLDYKMFMPESAFTPEVKTKFINCISQDHLGLNWLIDYIQTEEVFNNIQFLENVLESNFVSSFFANEDYIKLISTDTIAKLCDTEEKTQRFIKTVNFNEFYDEKVDLLNKLPNSVRSKVLVQTTMSNVDVMRSSQHVSIEEKAAEKNVKVTRITKKQLDFIAQASLATQSTGTR